MRVTARTALVAIVATAPLLWAATARPQDYPNRPVRIVVGFPAGTSADITARVVGAGSKLAADQVARAPKDGYTLLMANISNTITTSDTPGLSFDFQKDLAAV